MIDRRIAFIKAWSGNACTNSDNCSISSRIIEVQSHTFKNQSDLCYWILLQLEMQKKIENVTNLDFPETIQPSGKKIKKQ